MLPRLKKARLLKLAELLEADAKNKKGVKFDLTTWVKTLIFGETPDVSCGTQACALGLAALSGKFRGLTINNSNIGHDEFILVPSYFDGKRTYSNFAAGMRCFGITATEASLLFDPEYYPMNKLKGASAERYVAKRIRDFVAKGNMNELASKHYLI